MTLHGNCIVAGTPTAGNGQGFEAFDAAAGTPIEPLFHEATGAQVDAACRAALAAFPESRAALPETRARFLEAIASEIESTGDALLDRCRTETALPAARLQGERARTCGQLRLFAALVREGSWVDARIDRSLPDRKPLPRPDLRRMLLPLGPVAVFGASNFPLAFSVAGGDTASAIAAGCPVVIKGHPAHPGTCEMVAGAVVRAGASCGLPKGIFSMLHGGPAVGKALVGHPAIAAVAFTGSLGAGRSLFDTAASRKHPIPVFAEMGSVNPVFLLSGALRERGPVIADGLAASVTLGGGQFCTKPGLVFAPRGEPADRFLERLAGALAAQPSVPMLSPAITKAYSSARARTSALPGVAALPGAPEGLARVAAAADFLRTPAMATEVFGAFTLVVLVESAEQMLACADALEGQLTATVHATHADLADSAALLAQIERKAGRLVLNGFPTGVEVAPAMNHGGPYPATTDARFTSVGTAAIYRFARPVCYQGFPPGLLPPPLRDENPLGILRLVDGSQTRAPIG